MLAEQDWTWLVLGRKTSVKAMGVEYTEKFENTILYKSGGKYVIAKKTT